jgi:putative membrane protein
MLGRQFPGAATAMWIAPGRKSYYADRRTCQFRYFPRTVRTMSNVTALPRTGDASVALSIDRTRLSHDRTLMSWIRTATSLITFGFSIYKFFQLEAEKAAVSSARLIGPRGFAIAMIAIGLVSLTLATFEHFVDLHALKLEYPHAKIPRSTARLTAGMISILGIAAFVAAVFRQ